MKSFNVALGISMACVAVSCDSYDQQQTILDGLENITYECFDGHSEYYFRGIFRDDWICLYHGEYGYKASFGYGNGFVTLSSTFTTEELQTQDSKSYIAFLFNTKSEISGFLEGFKIKTQPQPFGTPLDSMVKAFLIPGTFPVRGVLEDGSVSTEGFEILMNQWHFNAELNPNRWNVTLTSALGVQPTSSHVTIHEVELQKRGEFYEGHILFDLNCKMYLSTANPITGQFGGDLSATLRLPIHYKP